MINISELFFPTAFAADEVSKASNLTSFMPLVLIMSVFYFLVLRPQQKKNKEHQSKLNELARGDEVMTSGGIIGTVVNLPAEGDIITVEIAKDVKIKVHRSHIAEFLTKKAVKETAKADKKNPPKAKEEEKI